MQLPPDGCSAHTPPRATTQRRYKPAQSRTPPGARRTHTEPLRSLPARKATSASPRSSMPRSRCRPGHRSPSQAHPTPKISCSRASNTHPAAHTNHPMVHRPDAPPNDRAVCEGHATRPRAGTSQAATTVSSWEAASGEARHWSPVACSYDARRPVATESRCESCGTRQPLAGGLLGGPWPTACVPGRRTTVRAHAVVNGTPRTPRRRSRAAAARTERLERRHCSPRYAARHRAGTRQANRRTAHRCPRRRNRAQPASAQSWAKPSTTNPRSAREVDAGQAPSTNSPRRGGAATLTDAFGHRPDIRGPAPRLAQSSEHPSTASSRDAPGSAPRRPPDTEPYVDLPGPGRPRPPLSPSRPPARTRRTPCRRRSAPPSPPTSVPRR